ncbi:sulfotransferase [Methylonatrum kenyense]|uniref:sulfotransferase family protein n=1 Tax=Methylonatrum kenyense TaxID=455253 RepID=UPI0020C13CE5|nr:sulfotransferase [Methylonatrum kenyense]MCK8516777.1 sulfotransferase [Methylonatrum kenyense]
MIEKPIFIVGTGRCGSTMFHDILRHHRDLGWLTQLAEQRPGRVYLNRWGIKALDYPVVGKLARRYLVPSEPYRFWEHHCHGFSRPYRDITEHDVIPRVVPRLRSALARSIPADKRLLAKITGWPRIRYLKRIFPDAKFVHIVRDGRAVVNSVLAAPYFDGWTGPGQWARGELSDAQRKAWQDSGESFVLLAAIGWENRMKAFEKASSMIPEEDYLEIRYEDFCKNKLQETDRTLDFLDLSSSRNSELFHRTVESITVSNQNQKWRSDLSNEQQAVLNDYLAPVIQRYGYE